MHKLRIRSPLTGTSLRKPQARQQAFDRFSAAAATPMIVLTIVMIPVLIIPILFRHLDSGLTNVLEAADYFIWGVFLLEYLIRLALAPRRWHFVVHNLPELVLVAVPVLRPLRLVRSVGLLRIMRLTRLTALVTEGATNSKRSLHARATNFALIVMVALILVTSVVVLDLERDAKGAQIKTFGDALWWAASTVGTGSDLAPVTAGGRAVAVVLMIGGLALIGIVTAAIAAFFVEQSDGRSKTSASQAELFSRLEAIETALLRLGEEPPAIPSSFYDRPRSTISPG